MSHGRQGEGHHVGIFRAGAFAVSFCCLLGSAVSAQQDGKPDFVTELKKLHWQTTGSGSIGDQATLAIPKDYGFLGAADSKRFIELQGNPPRDNRYVFMPLDLRWWGLFVFEDIGFVKDDDKIDPDALLESLKEQNQAGRAERQRLGLPSLTLEGWLVAPHYDVQTKRLEWGTKLRTDSNETVVNYTVKLLGRSGVMNAVLVSDPSHLDDDVKEFKAALNNYAFVSGKQYSEFKTGDKIAEYGLAALIVGGAAAAAMKSGALKGMLKFLGIGALAAGGILIGFFRRMFQKT
jgi:uncharacterized membrane-anchored protein